MLVGIFWSFTYHPCNIIQYPIIRLVSYKQGCQVISLPLTTLQLTSLRHMEPRCTPVCLLAFHNHDNGHQLPRPGRHSEQLRRRRIEFARHNIRTKPNIHPTPEWTICIASVTHHGYLEHSPNNWCFYQSLVCVMEDAIYFQYKS